MLTGRRFFATPGDCRSRRLTVSCTFVASCPIFSTTASPPSRGADYAIVGFTSTFEQNIASLSLARRIKMLHPNIAIVFGGANWEA